MVSLTEGVFGAFQGEAVKLFTWQTNTSFEVSVITYGLILQSIKVPDKYGDISDVVLGFDDLDSYVNRNAKRLGATIGRCASRIRGAAFQIDGVTYNLTKNSGENHIHGGLIGFEKVNWQSTVDGNKVIFSYYSKDGEEGYPGDLITNVICEVKDDNSLHMYMSARTTKKTVINLTNHAYFNLAGHDTGGEELWNHVIEVNADRVTENDNSSIPTGNFINVEGTKYDLRTPKQLSDPFDDNFCISAQGGKDLQFVSRVIHPSSGRFLEVHSNQPGVQLYTANFLPVPTEPALEGKNGAGYRQYGGFCLETQNYPDAVNHENFPNAVLSPGETYDHKVVYYFGVVNEDMAPDRGQINSVSSFLTVLMAAFFLLCFMS